jgi:hypothetical protein
MRRAYQRTRGVSTRSMELYTSEKNTFFTSV